MNESVYLATIEPPASVIAELVAFGNIKYGIIFAITTFILVFGIYTLRDVYKSYRMDTETKTITHIIAFVLLCVPLYLWTNSLINVIQINCFTSSYVHKELSGGK